MFGADTLPRRRHGPRVLGSTELLAEMRRLKEAGKTTNAELARLLSLPTARIAEIFDEKRRVTIDEMKLVVEHFQLPSGTPASPAIRPDTIDKAPDRPPVVGSGAIQLKRVDLGLSMGDGTNLDDYFEEEPFEFDAGLLSTITRAPPHRVIIARGDGDSMMPTLINDDMVAIDTTQTSLNRMDKIWAISLYGAGGIKRLNRVGPGKVEVVSDNQMIAPKVVDEEDLVILGRVVWVGRRM